MRAHEAGALHADVTTGPTSVLRPPADLTALDPRVWPRGVRRTAEGVLEVAGTDVRELAARFGTPLYVCAEDDFRSRCRDFAAAFGQRAGVYYAAKAFCCLSVLRWVAEEGLGLDVCTGGELAAALAAGFPSDRIAVHGNNKSKAELTRAVDAGVGQVVLDSFVEIDRLAQVAERRGVRQPVLVRVTVGVEAHTHEFIATAHEDQKFGFSMASGDAIEAARRVLKHPALELVGLHSHIGSQIFDTAAFEVSARRAVALLARIRDESGLELPVLDLGGGFGIAYTTDDDPLDVTTVAAQLGAIVGREAGAASLSEPRIVVEPGRAVAGPSTFTLYQVGTVKDVDGIRSYVSVDGGMSDNIRTALYDASYTCTLASRAGIRPDGANSEPMLARVVGRHCESGDILVRDAWLPADISPGDLLAVAATGAYCRSMASNYNHVPRPPVVAVRDGQARLLVRGETEDDLMRLDVWP